MVNARIKGKRGENQVKTQYFENMVFASSVTWSNTERPIMAIF